MQSDIRILISYFILHIKGLRGYMALNALICQYIFLLAIKSAAPFSSPQNSYSYKYFTGTLKHVFLILAVKTQRSFLF